MSREPLTPLESAAARELLRGNHFGLEVLRTQLRGAGVQKREINSAGLLTFFCVPEDLERLPKKKMIILQDVMGSINGKPFSAGFSLFILDGVLNKLEGHPEDGELWPEAITEFEIPPHGSERDLRKLTSP